MGVASHLGIKLGDYDRSIRTFIPHYADLLAAAADAVATLAPRRPRVVDLGTGTGALAAQVIKAVPGARITGIDADEGMLKVARQRLLRAGKPMPFTPIVGDFLSTPLHSSEVITASFSLHHVASRTKKAALYRRCAGALQGGGKPSGLPNGIFVSADCYLSSNQRLQKRQRAQWLAHLARTHGPTKAEGFLRAWAKEDFYFTLDAEVDLLEAAGFTVDVFWRRGAFAVIVGS
ncbi:MAG: class I SAM-dependent methyltransferase [Vicinamibacterales bacterium]